MVAGVPIGTDEYQNAFATEEVIMGETAQLAANDTAQSRWRTTCRSASGPCAYHCSYSIHTLPKFPDPHSSAERYYEYLTAEYFDAFLEWALAPILTREGAAKVELTACFLWLMLAVLLSQLQSEAPFLLVGHGRLDPEYPVSFETSF